MYNFSARSLERLKGVHPELVQVVHDVMAMQVMDFSVNEGVRSLARQKELVAAGKSKTMLSKHIVQNDGWGHAVDLYPSPIDMKLLNKGDMREVFRVGALAGLMLSAARKRGIILVNGADWDGDGQTLDHTFFDGVHFQLGS